MITPKQLVSATVALAGIITPALAGGLCNDGQIWVKQTGGTTFSVSPHFLFDCMGSED